MTKPGCLLEKIRWSLWQKAKGQDCHCKINRECHQATVRNQSGKGFSLCPFFFPGTRCFVKKKKSVVSVVVSYFGLEESGKKAGVHLLQPIMYLPILREKK